MSTGDAQFRNAAYTIADVFQIPLELKKGMLTGSHMKQGSIGPLKLKWPLKLKSDMIDGARVGALIQIRGHLWGYLFVDAEESPYVIWLALFNGGVNDFPDYITGDVRKTLKKIEKSIVACFQYKDSTDKWVPVDDWTDLPM